MKTTIKELEATIDDAATRRTVNSGMRISNSINKRSLNSKMGIPIR